VGASVLCICHGLTLTRDRRKIPWRLSPTQKFRQRKRLRAVDEVIATVTNALAKKGETLKSLERWKSEMPTEAEMLPRDKYTMFDRKAKRYRKGIHSMWLSGTQELLLQVVADIFGVRTPQVDPCLAENQPAWFLDDEERWFWLVYPMYYTNWNKRRYEGIKSWQPMAILEELEDRDTNRLLIEQWQPHLRGALEKLPEQRHCDFPGYCLSSHQTLSEHSAIRTLCGYLGRP